MRNLLFLLFTSLLILLAHEGQAQKKYSTSSGKAIKLYEKAREYLKDRRVDEGVEFLLKAVKADENFLEAHYQLGTTYRLYGELDEATRYYDEVNRIAPNDPKYRGVYLFLAERKLMKGTYEEAKSLARKTAGIATTSAENKKRANQIEAICDYAIKGKQQALNFEPKPLPAPINQARVQYFPVLTGDQNTLVYTVRLANETDDLYYSTRQGEVWSEPQNISDQINTQDNEGTCSISADGKTLVFTYCNNFAYRDSYGSCDLYISNKVGKQWTSPKNLGPKVNSGAKDTQPALSADGNTLYFASERAGGYGGMDIWMSKKDEDGTWTQALNLGNRINTENQDISPFIHVNNRTLFFSSNGYTNSYGGQDLYQSEFDYNTQEWSEPQNLGYPVNDHKDQVGLFVSTDGTQGYYTDEQYIPNSRFFESKLYTFPMPEEIRPEVLSNYVKGYVYDSQTQEKLEATIELFDLTESVKQASVSSDAEDGNYLIVLNQGSEYALEVNRKGYAFKSLTFNYAKGKDLKPLEINIALDPITQGTTFRLNNIFFDYNKYELQDKSKAELDELVKFMNENPKVKGKISGHTDNIGNPEDNIKLSLNRAKSVYDYLINSGIDSQRLSYEGYGDSQPAGSNETEEGRAQNRRIEFEILEIE